MSDTPETCSGACDCCGKVGTYPAKTIRWVKDDQWFLMVSTECCGFGATPIRFPIKKHDLCGLSAPATPEKSEL